MAANIDPKLNEVIRASWFTIEPGTYVYTRVSSVPHPEQHLMVTRDRDEITIVTETPRLPELGEFERNPENWKLVNIKCGKPFYCVGFLAAVATTMAENGLDITMTSTYTNDYIFFMEEELEAGVKLLKEIGFQERQTRDTV